jgi:hypothetical protein
MANRAFRADFRDRGVLPLRLRLSLQQAPLRAPEPERRRPVRTDRRAGRSSKINLSSAAIHDHGEFSPDGDLAVTYAENSPPGENSPPEIGQKVPDFMIVATFRCAHG